MSAPDAPCAVNVMLLVLDCCTEESSSGVVRCIHTDMADFILFLWESPRCLLLLLFVCMQDLVNRMVASETRNLGRISLFKGTTGCPRVIASPSGAVGSLPDTFLPKFIGSQFVPVRFL